MNEQDKPLPFKLPDINLPKPRATVDLFLSKNELLDLVARNSFIGAVCHDRSFITVEEENVRFSIVILDSPHQLKNNF